MAKKNVISVSAYTPPPNGYRTFRDNGQETTEWLGQTFQTEERYREYRECGFDELLIAGEDKYLGEEFETSKTKKLMDLCLKTDLKAIVYDERILRLSVDAQHSIIGEFYENQEELNSYVAECMKDYKLHPAFVGVSIIDEPLFSKKLVIEQICKAIKSVSPNAIVHTCLLPYFAGPEFCDTHFGMGCASEWDAFADYLEVFSKSLGYVHYDRYPFSKWFGEYMLTKHHFRVMQEAVKVAKKLDLPFWITGQTYSSGFEDATRPVDEHDMFWQVNLFLGFAVKKVYWYTYWRFSTRQSLTSVPTAVMDDYGERMIYDEVQRANAYMQKVAAFLVGYEYVASQFLRTENEKNDAAEELIETDLELFEKYDVDGCVLVNKLVKGENAAYMFMNARDSVEKKVNRVSITFAKPVSAIVVLLGGEKLEMPVENGRVDFALSPGEAVWVLEIR